MSDDSNIDGAAWERHLELFSVVVEETGKYLEPDSAKKFAIEYSAFIFRSPKPSEQEIKNYITDYINNYGVSIDPDEKDYETKDFETTEYNKTVRYYKIGKAVCSGAIFIAASGFIYAVAFAEAGNESIKVGVTSVILMFGALLYNRFMSSEIRSEMQKIRDADSKDRN